MSSRWVNARRKSLRPFGMLVLAGCALWPTGCRTSDDAVAAASQMSLTAKALSDYYDALGTILAETDRIQSVNDLLYSKPYPPEVRQEAKKTEAELAKRAKLAADFSYLAADFAALSDTGVSANVVSSAQKLEGECESLSGFTSNSQEQNAMKLGLQLLVTAVQEKKEREAAKGMDAATQGLADLFVKETPEWNSIDRTYVQLASTLANELVKADAVDNSGMLKVALEPFGLVPKSPATDINTKLTPMAEQQIAERKDALDVSFTAATDAMSRSLREMARRVHLVATDRPLAFRLPPFSLAVVEQWAAKFMPQ